MADFRRWIYALAVVALLAGFTVPANADVGSPPFTCSAVSVAPITRAEGYVELVGDIALNCSGLENSSALADNLSISINFNVTPNIESAQLSTLAFANPGNFTSAGNANSLDTHITLAASVITATDRSASSGFQSNTVELLASTNAVTNIVVSAALANNVNSAANIGANGATWIAHGGSADANPAVSNWRPALRATSETL